MLPPAAPIPVRGAVSWGEAPLLLRNWQPAAGQRITPDLYARRPQKASGHYDLRLADGIVALLSPRIAPETADRQIDLKGAFLLPGLIDCHVHLALGDAGAVAHARQHLAAGVTAVRSLGERVDVSGELAKHPDLPRIVPAGRALAPAGRYGGFLGREVRPGESLARAVEEEVARGARVIKVILSGSVDFERGTAEGPYFSASELGELVAAARSMGVPLACHANGYPSVRLAAAAGVDSIEHGILAGEDGVRAMAEAGLAWVPTLTPLKELARQARWPALPGILEDHRAAVRLGFELGLDVLPGTDGGSPGVPHGNLFAELNLLASAGLPPGALAAAATWRAAELLRLPAGYGRLAQGAVTDLVWFREDPLADPSQVEKPLGVIVAGRLALARGFDLNS